MIYLSLFLYTCHYKKLLVLLSGHSPPNRVANHGFFVSAAGPAKGVLAVSYRFVRPSTEQESRQNRSRTKPGPTTPTGRASPKRGGWVGEKKADTDPNEQRAGKELPFPGLCKYQAKPLLLPMLVVPTGQVEPLNIILFWRYTT